MQARILLLLLPALLFAGCEKKPDPKYERRLSQEGLRFTGNELGEQAGDGDLEAVRLLLDAGLHPDALGPTRRQPRRNALSKAASRGHLEVVKLLLDRGADPNFAHHQHGETALTDAAHHGEAEIAELLIARGARVGGAITTNDQTPLILATKKRRAAVVRVLLAAGADRDHRDADGATALDHARRIESEELIRLLGGPHAP